ncbi:MAG: protein kinase, partial [Clostridiales bacterium]
MLTLDKIYKYEPLWGKWNVENTLGDGNLSKVYKMKTKQNEISVVKIFTIPTKVHHDEFYSNRQFDKEKNEKQYFYEIVEKVKEKIETIIDIEKSDNILNFDKYFIKEHINSIGWDILIKMDYLKSLGNYISENNFTLREIIKMGIDISNALELCHKNKIIHKNLKENNIFITDNGTFKLSDFNLLDDSIEYSCPEIMNGRPYKSNIDIYSLGLILYKLMNFNRLPFVPDYPKKINQDDLEKSQLKRLLGEKLIKPRNCEDDFGNIIIRACESDPELRYQKAGELKNDLIKLMNKYSKEKLDKIIITNDINKKNELTGVIEKENINDIKINQY